MVFVLWIFALAIMACVVGLIKEVSWITLIGLIIIAICMFVIQMMYDFLEKRIEKLEKELNKK